MRTAAISAVCALMGFLLGAVSLADGSNINDGLFFLGFLVVFISATAGLFIQYGGK